MNDFDDRIRDGIKDQVKIPLFDTKRDEKLFKLVTDSYRKGRRWLVLVSLMKTLFFAAIAVFSAVKFFGAVETKELIGWATLFLVGMTSMSMMATVFWMDLNRNAVARDMRRMEIRLMEAWSVKASD